LLTTRTYQPGDEVLEFAFDQQVAGTWPWPVAYTEEGLARTITSPSFDPNHHIYAFDGDQMVGKAEIWATHGSSDGPKSAYVLFPRTLPAFESAVDPLFEHLMRVLNEQEFGKLRMPASTAWSGSIEWLQSHGFAADPDQPLGFKKYLSYDLSKGPAGVATDNVIDLDMERDRDDIAHAASVWLKCSHENAIEHVEQLLKDEETIAHIGVRENGEITAAAQVAKNWYRPSTAALFYAYARNARALRQLAAGAIEACIQAEGGDLLVDVIGAHLCFEPTYIDMGFVEVASHAVFEKVIR